MGLVARGPLVALMAGGIGVTPAEQLRGDLMTICVSGGKVPRLVLDR